MAAKKSTAKDKDLDKAAQDKNAALETVLSKIERDCGKGSIMRLGDNVAMNVSAVSTGSLSLDFALGIGGIPRGRITEIYGPESSGKTTIALHVIAEAQKEGGKAAFIDAEHALDPLYAKKLGVDINELLVSQPDCGEQGLEIAEMLVNSGAIDVIVIDSVAALVPRQEIEGDMGQATVGVQANAAVEPVVVGKHSVDQGLVALQVPRHGMLDQIACTVVDKGANLVLSVFGIAILFHGQINTLANCGDGVGTRVIVEQYEKSGIAIKRICAAGALRQRMR